MRDRTRSCKLYVTVAYNYFYYMRMRLAGHHNPTDGPAPEGATRFFRWNANSCHFDVFLLIELFALVRVHHTYWSRPANADGPGDEEALRVFDSGEKTVLSILLEMNNPALQRQASRYKEKGRPMTVYDGRDALRCSYMKARFADGSLFADDEEKGYGATHDLADHHDFYYGGVANRRVEVIHVQTNRIQCRCRPFVRTGSVGTAYRIPNKVTHMWTDLKSALASVMFEKETSGRRGGEIHCIHKVPGIQDSRCGGKYTIHVQDIFMPAILTLSAQRDPSHGHTADLFVDEFTLPSHPHPITYHLRGVAAYNGGHFMGFVNNGPRTNLNSTTCTTYFLLYPDVTHNLVLCLFGVRTICPK